MSENRLPANAFNDELSLKLPAFRDLPAISLDISTIKTAESRLIEAKDVGSVTYADLEHCFGEAYRNLKKHLATVSFQLMRLTNEMNKRRSILILDTYPDFIKDKPRSMDNSASREAFITKDSEIQDMIERFDSLKALEIFLEGRVKVMENVSRYMKKRMDLLIRSGAKITF